MEREAIKYELQSNLVIRNFLVTLKLFLITNTYITLWPYKVYLMMNQEKTCPFLHSWKSYLMKNKEKMAPFLQSIKSLVPKEFHKMSGSRISGTLFKVKFQNWYKNLCSLTPNFDIF